MITQVNMKIDPINMDIITTGQHKEVNTLNRHMVSTIDREDNRLWIKNSMDKIIVSRNSIMALSISPSITETTNNTNLTKTNPNIANTKQFSESSTKQKLKTNSQQRLHLIARHRNQKKKSRISTFRKRRQIVLIRWPRRNNNRILITL